MAKKIEPLPPVPAIIPVVTVLNKIVIVPQEQIGSPVVAVLKQITKDKKP